MRTRIASRDQKAAAESRSEAAKGVVRESPKDGGQVRLTLYTTPEKDFALRYLALKKRTSLNQLVNESWDDLLHSEKIDPATLPQALP